MQECAEEVSVDGTPERNELLSGLPPDVFEAIRPGLSLVELEFRQSLHEPAEPTPYVYFPLSGVISLLTVLQNGAAVEMGTAGNEGMIDISSFLGVRNSESRCIVQVPGRALRMTRDDFRKALDRHETLRALVGAYVMEFFTMVAQSSACNRSHELRERTARWILMTHDRVGSDKFPITQEFLAEMLGVQRPSVTHAAVELATERLIAYRRGVMTVIDRKGLENASCECYRLIRNRFDRIAKMRVPAHG